ncbi:MAG: ATP-binding protein [Campylobacterota bacterium]|nr:ATP-binding protein [Campylobacterota bacterium]
MKQRSLQNKFLIYLLLFSIVPLIVGSSVILYQMYKNTKESIYHNHYQILKKVEEESNNILLEIENSALFIKQEYFKENNILTSIIKLKRDINTILILDNEGILKDYSSSYNMNIFNGFDYSNMDYFKAIKKGKDNYWSKVYLSNINQKPAISYSIRIDKNNIAVIMIDLSILNDFSKKFKSKSGDYLIRIIDQNGIFIAHPTKEKYVLQRKSALNTALFKSHFFSNNTNKQVQFRGIDKSINIGIYGITNKLKWNIIVKESYEDIFSTFYNTLWFIIGFVVFIITVSIYFSIKFSSSILKPLEKIILNMKELAKGNYKGKLLKTNYIELKNLIITFSFMQKQIKQRELKIKDEIVKNQQKDKLLFEQSKMASMGEMIGNIAHQWRQPLSVISTAASGIKLEKEYNMLTDENLINHIDSIMNSTTHLSQTIDDFRNFFKSSKNKEIFHIKDIILKNISLLESTFKSNHITVSHKGNSDIQIYSYQNEFIQATLNIINNSKDILKEKNQDEEKFIFIEYTYDTESVKLTIKDNGGGIPLNIIDKIFEPYFTTKHKSQGTGIGLYMTRQIIVDHMNGYIGVENCNYNYNGKLYDGAMFTIKLPIEKELKND